MRFYRDITCFILLYLLFHRLICFRSPFATDSLLSLSTLASGLIRDPSSFGDIELLRSLHHLLQRMNKVSTETTFSNNLEALLGAVLDFVTTVGQLKGIDHTSGTLLLRH